MSKGKWTGKNRPVRRLNKKIKTMDLITECIEPKLKHENINKNKT